MPVTIFLHNLSSPYQLTFYSILIFPRISYPFLCRYQRKGVTLQPKQKKENMKEVKHGSRLERSKFNRKQKLATMAYFLAVCGCLSEALYRPLLYNIPLNELILSTPIQYDYLSIAIRCVAYGITMLAMIALLLAIWLVGKYTPLFSYILEENHTCVRVGS